MLSRNSALRAATLISLSLAAAVPRAAEVTAPTAAEARAFVERAEVDLEKVAEYAERASWVHDTYITSDTDWLVAKATAEETELGVRYAREAARFDKVTVDDVTRRKLYLLKQGVELPSATRPGAAQELADIRARLESQYSTAKLNYQGRLLSLDELSEILRTSRDPTETRALWEGWRAVSSPPMKSDYARLVELANEGARELGYADTGVLWRSRYDMPPASFERKVDALWTQVKPLYQSLACYVRDRLSQHYGVAVQPASGPIRADLLGNMWSQQWGTIYDLVAPKAQSLGYDLTAALVAHGYDAIQMAQVADRWYQSIGFAPEPASFWERSLFTRPRDREVVCHASAWEPDRRGKDLRVKVCLRPTADDFYTIHHELGHTIYFRAYSGQPFLFRRGANEGFHEAIGDFAALNALAPDYLRQIGLIDQVPGPEADIPYLLSMALDKVPMLAFSIVVDKWRWDVFAGKITPAHYTEAWGALAARYQGVTPPGARPSDAFDPGAKFHIASSVPYTRYFLADIYEFQFYRAACRAAGWTGPLNRCSILGNKAVGQQLARMLELGGSKPWPDALAAFTGERDIDASAVADYFAPLAAWLDRQNAGHACTF